MNGKLKLTIGLIIICSIVLTGGFIYGTQGDELDLKGFLEYLKESGRRKTK